MTPSAEVQPSFEDVFRILSQLPEDKLLNLKHKLKHLIVKPCSKLLQAMVLLTLRQEADARVCLDALRDEQAALYVHRARLGPAGLREDGEDPHPPQLDAGALVLLARIYSLLVDEKLCGREAMVRAYQRVIEACGTRGDPQREPLNSVLAEAQEKCGAALGFAGSGSRFQTLRSAPGIAHPGSASAVARSSPVPIGSVSEPSGPRSLRSSGSPASFTSRFEISESPTAVFRSRSPRGGAVPPGSRAGAASPDSQPAQGTAALAPGPEKPLPAASRHPPLPDPDTPSPRRSAANRPVESGDISSTSPAEPQAPKAPRREDLAASAPEPGGAAQPAPVPQSVGAPRPAEDAPATAPFHAPSPAPACSLPPRPSAFPSAPPNFAYPPSVPSPFPAACPPPAAASPARGEERKFFTFVVLHASNDADTALRVKGLLEGLGVPDGATFCEDFLTGGRGQFSCFQEAMENSAFTILLLTKNFLCQLCIFQTNSALMESIRRPSKHNSVIPFVPKENPLEEGEIPIFLQGLVPLNENSAVFSTRVRNTFTHSKVSEQKALWKQRQHSQEQQRKLQLYQEYCQTLGHFSALNLGSLPQAPWSA
ncbi:TCAM1 protein, partial [Nothocercus nigrocapillus]|nr:TCAM1 protein [Nothocercus nigrocapillus]